MPVSGGAARKRPAAKKSGKNPSKPRKRPVAKKSTKKRATAKKSKKKKSRK